ncbi:MAG TPA: HIT family protein [Thiobacillaceae bacterium]|nr:HIT family protein [Thiobacillaceae bacterium]HNA81601.1 HIT family protein [Thiobacillaceae bacterium]HNI07917.1 HIT family protein [Thiobacillaceae bacterium]
MKEANCPLCSGEAGEVLWRDGFCRVIWVEDADYPGFCRVILDDHIREMTDLSAADRCRLMDVVFATEAVVRTLFEPDKINLASLGNMVPHLHWHVIPRLADDRHFPDAIWAQPRRAAGPRPVAKAALKAKLVALLGERLGLPRE